MDRNEMKETSLKSIRLANSFLKVTLGLREEATRADGLPLDLAEHLATEELNMLVNRDDVEPEMLVWGLIKVIDLLMDFGDISMRDITYGLDVLIEKITNGEIE